MEEPPPKKTKLSPDLESDDDAMLADSVWASLDTGIAAVDEAVSDDDEDFSHLLDLSVPDEATTEAAPLPDYDALLSSMTPVHKAEEADPAVLDLAAEPVKEATETNETDGDTATLALQNLQQMLADVAAEAGADDMMDEDEVMMSEEDEVLASEGEAGMAIDEALASDDEDLPPFIRLACTICSTVFPNEEDLSIHLHTHIPNRAFICEGCGKSFSRQDALKRHALGPSATNDCQETSLEPNERGPVEMAETHAKLLKTSLEGGPVDPETADMGLRNKKVAPPPPTTKKVKPKAEPSTSGVPRPIVRTQPTRQQYLNPPAPLPMPQPKSISDPDWERRKPGIAALQAAHLCRILSRLPPTAAAVEEALRLSGMTGEQVALLHFAFSEICRHQKEFMTSYSFAFKPVQ